ISVLRQPPHTPPLFPYTTLFRSESIQYFTARVSARPHNPSAPLDQQVYLRALRTLPNLTITFGHFLTHSIPMMLSGTNPPKRVRSEEHTSELQSRGHLVCRLLLE